MGVNWGLLTAYLPPANEVLNVTFSQVSVCPQGVSAELRAGIHTPQDQRQTPPRQVTPGQTPPGALFSKQFLHSVSVLYHNKVSFCTVATNINGAVTEGVRNVADNVRRLSQGRETPLSPLILFLTDGLPSAGEQNLDKIIDNVKRT